MTSPSYIDETLAAGPIARALREVGYTVVTKDDLPEFDGLSRVLDDEHIIPWLRDHDAIWVHADDRARVEHAKLLVAGNVRTIWVYRPGGRLSLRHQLRVLAFALPAILDKFEKQRRIRHYKVRLMSDEPDGGIRLGELRIS